MRFKFTPGVIAGIIVYLALVGLLLGWTWSSLFGVLAGAAIGVLVWLALNAVRVRRWRKEGTARADQELETGAHAGQARSRQSQSALELYESSGRSLADAPLRTQEILRSAHDSHYRERDDDLAESDAAESTPATPGPLHAHQLTAEDAKAIREFSGTNLNPDETVELPSGLKVTGRELQLWLDSH